MTSTHVHDSDTAYDGTCECCLCSTEGCPGTVEYRCVVLDQDGNEGRARLACGDGECVFQAVYYLLGHVRNLNGVLVQEWAAE